MKLPAPIVVAALLLPAAVAVRAADPSDGMRACRGLSDGAARLACYDSVPVAAPAAVPAPVATQPAVVVVPATAAATPAAARTPTVPVAAGPAPAVAAPAAPVAAAPAAPVAAAPAARSADSQFGLEDRRAAAVQEVSSSIAGLFEGWGPATKFRLDNGQVWQITDGSSASYYLRSPNVKVARAALGSFRLEIEGARQAPRVRRVE